MKAIILAAGYATRLYPITLDIPKPLIMVGEKLMVEHILSKIEEVDEVSDVFIITNDKFYQKFVEWSKDFKYSKPLKILNDGTKSNEDRLGAIGDIHFVVEKEKINDDLMVIAGDNLFEFSLADLTEFFKNKNASVVAVYDLVEKEKLAKKFGVVELDENSRVIGFEEKPEHPKTSLTSTACYIFTKKGLGLLERCIRENKKPDNLGDFIKWLSEREHMYGFVFKERWFDIGGHEQLEEVRKIYGEKEKVK